MIDGIYEGRCRNLEMPFICKEYYITLKDLLTCLKLYHLSFSKTKLMRVVEGFPKSPVWSFTPVAILTVAATGNESKCSDRITEV